MNNNKTPTTNPSNESFHWAFCHHSPGEHLHLPSPIMITSTPCSQGHSNPTSPQLPSPAPHKFLETINVADIAPSPSAMQTNKQKQQPVKFTFIAKKETKKVQMKKKKISVKKSRLYEVGQ